MNAGVCTRTATRSAGSPPTWIVAQIGAREHYAIAAELHRRTLLRRLDTDYWSRSGASAPRWNTLLRALTQRRTSEVPDSLVKSHNLRTLIERLVRPLHLRETPHDAFEREGRAFAQRIADDVRRLVNAGEAGCFFGYTSGALEILQRLEGTGAARVLDQIDPSLVEERIVQREREEYPGWEEHARPVPESYYQRSWEEWRQADVVVVNSRWTWSALRELGVPEDKLFILPLLYRPAHQAPPVRTRTGALRLVWAGTVNLRKGIHYLMKAAELLRHCRLEIKVAGSIQVNEKMLERAPPNIAFLGRVTRQEIRDVYAWGDVYVLPTVSDGFAITQLEAMAHGLPVITTDRCGEVVEHRKSGLIVPARSAEELAAAIEGLAGSRETVDAMAREAWKRAQQMCNDVFPRCFEDLLERVARVRQAA